MDIDNQKEDKGKLFLLRVQQVLKNHDNITARELLDKVDEMKDLMTTLAKMLKQTTQKMRTIEMERDNLLAENKTILKLVNDLEKNLNSSNMKANKLVSKSHQYDELKEEFEKMKTELSELQSLKQNIKNSSGDTILTSETEKKKSKKTQTNVKKNSNKSLLAKLEYGVPVVDEINFESTYEKHDSQLHKLQTMLLHREQTWHQISSREREQRSKLCRLVKEMRVLRNQLDSKNNLLSYKEDEIREKTKLLAEAERKITDLKKYIRFNKRIKSSDVSVNLDNI